MSARHAKKTSIPYMAVVKPSSLSVIYDYMETILFAMLLLVLFFTFFFRIAGVKGGSMEPTLHNGERLVLATHFYEPAHGDIVVISRYTEEPLIKRVIGVAGDTIRIDTVSGIVYRNGEPLEERYISAPTDRKEMEEEVSVPAGYIFVLGDNRPVSKDSRSESVGLVDTESVVGKAVWRIWPLNRFGIVK